MIRGLTESKRTFFQMPGSIYSILNSSFSKEIKGERKGKRKKDKVGGGTKRKRKEEITSTRPAFCFLGEYSSFEVTQARLLALLSQNRLPHFYECSNPLYAME